MKIFHKQLDEYTKEPEIKEVAPLYIPDPELGVDIPHESDWLDIPGAKHRIMKSYVTFNGKEIEDMSYFEILQTIDKLRTETQRDFRLPYLEELIASQDFYKGRSGARMASLSKFGAFLNSLFYGFEWVGENISTGTFYKGHIFRYPLNMRPHNNSVGHFNNDILIEDISFESGYYNKQISDNHMYPRKVSQEPEGKSILWEISEKKKPYYNVVRGYNQGKGVTHVFAFTDEDEKPNESIKFRLVEKNSPNW